MNLVVQTAFLGDLLLSIPLLKHCRRLWPSEPLGLVCRKGFGDFFLTTRLVDQVFEIEKNRSETYRRALRELRALCVKRVISPHQSFRTALFCRRIRAESTISFEQFWNFWAFSERVRRIKELPDTLRQLSLLTHPKLGDGFLTSELSRYLQSEAPNVPDHAGRLPPPPDWASMNIREHLLELPLPETLASVMPSSDSNRSVLLFPGSVWATKRWPHEGFVATGKSLREWGFPVIVMGALAEEPLAREVASQIPESICLAGQTSILESAQLIARSALVIGNDSASTHLAAACGTPVIAVFGPTVLSLGYRPWSTMGYVVETTGLSCRPCGKHGHEVCPLGTHECMKGILPEQVLRVARTILG